MRREARFQDIPQIVDLFHRTFARTHYALKGIGGIDEGRLKSLLMQAIRAHGGKHEGSFFIQVGETAGRIEALIIGTLQRVYLVGDRLMCTDLFWIASPEADPKDAAGLFRAMLAWGQSSPHVVEFQCGATRIIQNPEKAGRMMKAAGFEDYGAIWRKEVRR